MNKRFALTRYCFLIFIALLIGCPGFAEPLTTTESGRLRHQPFSEHFSYETFYGQNDGLDGAIAWQLNLYLNQNIFLCGYTSWASTGIRGGFGIASAGLGYKHWLSPQLYWDCRLVAGAGGGKFIDAAGGFCVQVFSGFGFKLIDMLFLETKAGYLMFPGGTFSVPLMSFGLGYHYNLLSL